MKDEEKEIIKGVYKNLLDVVEVNHPDYYMMPKTFYNSIMETLVKLERYLKLRTDSRNLWRVRAEKAKTELKELKK